MNVVRSVTGDVPSTALGVTACHEHLIIDSPVVADRFPGIHLPSVEAAVAELDPWHRAGLGTVVDAMPVAQGGDAARLAAISRRSGVHVVASTGLHTSRYDVAPPPRRPADLVDRFVADLTAPEHRCGVVKVSTGPDGFDARARALFTAAAEAAAVTGAPILTHCENGAGGPDQVAMLSDLGVDPGRVALSHTDKVADAGYHDDLLSSGVNLVYDQCLRTPEATSDLVIAMLAAGHTSGLMLGTDGARRSLWAALGGSPGLAWLLAGFVPTLERRGVDPDTITEMLVANPGRWLAMTPPRPTGTAS